MAHVDFLIRHRISYGSLLTVYYGSVALVVLILCVKQFRFSVVKLSLCASFFCGGGGFGGILLVKATGR